MKSAVYVFLSMIFFASHGLCMDKNLSEEKDNPPNSQMVFSMAKERTEEWDAEFRYSYWHKTLEDLSGFIASPSCLERVVSFSATTRKDYVFLPTSLENLSQYVYLHVREVHKRSDLEFNSYLSFPNIYSRLHGLSSFGEDEEVYKREGSNESIVETFNQDIETWSENLFVRFCILVAYTREYFIYTIFDSEEQKEEGIKIMERIKELAKW